MQYNIRSLRAIVILSAVLLPSSHQLSAQNNQLRQSLEKHVYTLASDSLKGRLAGSEESRRAGDYIIAQLEGMGLKVDLQTFSRPMRGEIATMENIIATIEGSDPQLKEEWIVIGAHYDHIGISSNSKNRPTDDADVINNGADDNASGVAAVIELARIFKGMEGELKRSIMFIAFDGEEQGLWGSTYFVLNPPIPLEKIAVMLSLDMVGYLQKSGWLKYEGIGTIDNLKRLISQNINPDFKVKYKQFEMSFMGATDTHPFALQRIPTLYVSTGLLSPYHQPADEADRIDYKGLASVTNHVSEVVDIIANNKAIKPSGRFSPIHVASYPWVSYGVTAGIGSAHFRYKGGSVNGKSILSYSAGIFANVDIFKYFSVRPEILYERAGSKYLGYWNSSNPNIYEPSSGKVSFDALTIPVSLRVMPSSMYMGSIPSHSIYVSVSGYYRRILSISMFDHDIASNDPRFNWNEWGFGWGAGVYIFGVSIGYEVKYGLNHFMFNANGNYAVKNISSQIKLSYRL